MALIGMVEDIIKLVNIVFFKVKMFANDLSQYAIKSKSIWNEILSLKRNLSVDC